MEQPKKSEQMVLELIYDHLIDNRVNNIFWRNSNKVLDLMAPCSDGTVPIASIYVDDEKPETLSIHSDVLRLFKETEEQKAWNADRVQIPLTNPNALQEVLDVLESCANGYNQFARLCDIFGNSMLGQLNYSVSFSHYEFRRKLPPTVTEEPNAKGV